MLVTGVLSEVVLFNRGGEESGATVVVKGADGDVRAVVAFER